MRRFWANVIDIAPNQSGLVLGISNTVATIPGIVGNIVTGYLINKTGSWDSVFALTIGFYVFGWIVYIAWAKGTPQFR